MFIGPRKVAAHALRAATGDRQRTSLTEHRPSRGQAAAELRSFEEDEFAAAGPPFAEFAAVLRKRALRWPIALRRLAQLGRDYPPVRSPPRSRPRSTMASTTSIVSSP